MFDHKHYVPIIRWKQGEQIALRELFPEDKARLTPLIQLTGDVAAKYSASRGLNPSITNVINLKLRTKCSQDVDKLAELA